jgi:hypothetical protein
MARPRVRCSTAPPMAVASGAPFLGRCVSMPLVNVIDPFEAIIRLPCFTAASAPPEADRQTVACRSKIEVSRGGKHRTGPVARCDCEMIEGTKVLEEARYAGFVSQIDGTARRSA